MRRVALLTALVVLSPVHFARAGEPFPVKPGDRMRVWVHPAVQAGMIEGEVAAVGRATLWLVVLTPRRLRGTLQPIPLTSVRSFAAWRDGTLVDTRGLVEGVLAAAMLAFAPYHGGCYYPLTSGDCAALVAFFGGVTAAYMIAANIRPTVVPQPDGSYREVAGVRPLGRPHSCLAPGRLPHRQLAARDWLELQLLEALSASVRPVPPTFAR
ncbi:MAG: hypothetical protein GTN78_20785 [Gemmatimonadales bacterium]|nr:hypothetical protein [Gemmatimonadales bacterium]NIN10119.1 hypothetical protein [Gemmatimonadales bacterium]NIR02603.1 hypothetical protein [Gemmatimonadales bacterium]NIS66297.1 hypothetical protein [Gemmatimonadales bacterium]